VRLRMSFQARHELVALVAGRYREATGHHKSAILDECVAVTGSARTYAIRLLSRPTALPVGPIRRQRPRRYGEEAQAPLEVAWAAAKEICAKRLVPFLPEVVAALERHGHLTVSSQARAKLLQISPATADRLLRARRQRDHPRGISTTKAGALLTHHVPVRTFTDGDDVQPGFLEADLVTPLRRPRRRQLSLQPHAHRCGDGMDRVPRTAPSQPGGGLAGARERTAPAALPAAGPRYRPWQRMPPSGAPRLV
jgi:hypothetical protein